MADRELDPPHLVAGVPELAKRLKLRKTLCHIFEGFAPHIELAGRQPRPGIVDALALKVGDPQLAMRRSSRTVVAPDIDAVLRVDRRNHLVPHRAPDVLVGELLENFHVDRNAVVLHHGGHGGEFAVIERDAEVDHGSISTNMRGSKRHKASTSLAAVFQDQSLFFRRKRPAAHDAVAHGVLLLGTDGIEPVVTEAPSRPLPSGVERPLVRLRKIGFRSRIRAGSGQPSARWQAHSAFATKLTNSARSICPVWRQLAELVAPQPDRPPAAQFARHQADNIGTFSRPRDELEIERPDLVERQLTYRCHGRPTSGKADAPRCRATGPCRERPA